METPMDTRPSTAAAAADTVLDRDLSKLDLTKRTRVGERIIGIILFVCGIISIFTTLGIVVVLGQESLLFFQSRAWILARTPVAAEEATAVLANEISAGANSFTITFDSPRIPYNPREFVQIGEEFMRITDRGTDSLTVERGYANSPISDHAAGAPIFAAREAQIRPLEDMAAEDTIMQLEPGFADGFEVGQHIQVGTEIMEIAEVNEDESSLRVIRGVEGTTARSHDAGEDQIFLPDPVTITEFFTSTSWQPQVGDFGIWPLMLSTLIVSTIAITVAVPLGLGAAIYLSEYASPRVRGTLKPILEVLAGVPTVVFGFFALTTVTPALQGIFGQQVQFYNMLAAGLVVGVLIIPLISSMSEDALNAVPRALREASYGLGATKLETTIKVVFPAAISGILAAVILAISRAVGETMIVAIAAGAGPNFTFNVFEGAETMTGHIARISGGDLSYNSIDYNSIFAIGAMLFILTLLLNILSGWVARRLREAY